jgi:hypothetical protein
MCLYGAMGRRSLEAETLNIMPHTPPMTTNAKPVFVFHAFGAGHHPPVGVQVYIFIEKVQQKCQVAQTEENMM